MKTDHGDFRHPIFKHASIFAANCWCNSIGVGDVVEVGAGVKNLQVGDEVNVYEQLQDMTSGRGPDRCIDAVGCEALAGGSVDGMIDAVKTATFIGTDRPHVIRQTIWCCRKAGTISIPGVYVGAGDKIPIGALMNKGLTIKTGQTHKQRYMKPLSPAKLRPHPVSSVSSFLVEGKFETHSRTVRLRKSRNSRL